MHTNHNSLQIKEKRLHVPQIDRLPEEAPPRLVAIVGPPGVGKTTLLKSLIRRYAKETLSEPQGPITVVTSKKQRLTFVECPNELEAMVDIAKVADIVLLMIDGNYGFEMETMEFLNILASTGMPGNVFGVLTHLDLFRKPQGLKDAKKRLKRRLWTELYQGAHLFYLSGVLNGRYPDREIHNLSRFLSVMKNPRPLVWRNTHPYSIIDSFRDITHPTKIEEDPKCDRSIVLSGYLRGTNFAASDQRVHVPGLGDFTVSGIESLPDPCPTPAMDQAIAKATGKTGRRRLDEKEKKLHAPMSDRSGLKIDGDAIWITREKGFTFNKDDEEQERGEGEELIVGLQSERRLLGETEEGVQLFKGGDRVDKSALEADGEEGQSGRTSQRKPRRAAQDDENWGEGEEDGEFASGDEEEGSDVETEFNEGRLGSLFRGGRDEKSGGDDVAFADSDSDLGSISGAEDGDSDAEEDEDGEDEEDEEEYDSDEETAALRWKDNLNEVAKNLHGKRPAYRTADLARYLYDGSMSPKDVLQRWKGEAEEEEENIEDDEEDFFQKKKTEDEDIAEDRYIPIFDYDALATKWSQDDIVESIRDRFATVTLSKKKRSSEDGDEDGSDDEDVDLEMGDDDDEDPFGDSDEDDDGDGAFEDLETGEVHGKPQQEGPEDVEAERQKNAQRKEELKMRFEEEDREGFLNDKANARRDAGVTADEFGEDEWYESQKAMIQKQLDINKSEFEQLDERQRVAVEGYKAGKYAKIVLENVPAEFVENFKSSNPIIIGGLTPTEDRFGYVQVRIKRHRWHKKILKTNDPLIVSLGWRRFQTLPIYSISDSRTRNRMLKYTPEHMHCFGTFYGPLIAPNTGFAAFNSLSSSNAGFRISATGTVLSVDESTEIVKKLKLTGAPYKIYKNTAFIKNMFNTSLEIAKFEGAAIKTVSGIRGQIKRALSKPEGCFRATFEDKILMSDIVFLRAWYPIKPHRFYNPATNLVGWQAMRLTGAIRAEQGVPTPKDRNSQYRKIERVDRHFNPLRVPKQLAAELPFKSQIVETKKQKNKTYMQKRAVVLGGEEKKARALVHMLGAIRNEKEEKRRAKKEEGRKEFRKKMAEVEEKKAEGMKRDRDQFWQKEGKRRAGWDQGGGGKKQRV